MKNQQPSLFSLTGILLAIAALLCLNACSTTYYAVPHDGHMLKLSDKGDVKASASAAFTQDRESTSFGEAVTTWSREVAVTGGYSPIKHLGLSGRFIYSDFSFFDPIPSFTFPAPTPTPHLGSNVLGELGVGGYKELTFENWQGRFLFDGYGGIGMGHSKNHNPFGGTVNLTYFNFSLQPNVHFYPADFVSISLGLRYESRISQKAHVLNIAPGDPDWPSSELTRQPHSTVMRILRVDFHVPYGSIYIGSTANYGGLSTGYFAGLGLDIQQFRKKKGKTPKE